VAVYSAQVLDHFQNPRNAGKVSDPDAVVTVENPGCGDVLQLSLKIENQRIVEVRFKAKGCVPAMACGSLLTEMLHGRTLAEAHKISREQLLAASGGLPDTSLHASHLAMETLAAALKRLQ
jgi:nitrogen fixation protein NifU and related proteins